MASELGYNPYRDAQGKFARPEDVGQKIDSDLKAAYDANDFGLAATIEDYVMENRPTSELGETLLNRRYGLAPKTAKPKFRESGLNDREQELREEILQRAKKIVETRAEHGEVTFDEANPERAQRRLQEALNFAETRGNTNLASKLASAKVLPSGAFQRKSDKRRVNTDAALKAYLTEKEVDAGRAKIEEQIQARIDSGAIVEGKYMHRDESGTYSLTVAPSFNQESFDSLDEATRAAISSPKESYSIELAREKLTAEQLEAVTNSQQVMDFVVGKKPEITGVPRPDLSFTGRNPEEVATNSLKSLSGYTRATTDSLGSRADRNSVISDNAEIIKSAVAKREQNTFVPGRAYGNGALLSSRQVLSPKDLVEHLTPAQLKSITAVSPHPDPQKAQKILPREQYEAIFERPTAFLRVTPKRSPKK